MALRQLAGPFTIQTVDGTKPKPSSNQLSLWLWYPNSGLVTIVSGKLGFITLDGIYATFANAGMGWQWAWWQDRSRLMSSYGGTEYVREPKVLNMSLRAEDLHLPIAAFNYVRIGDRTLYFNGWRVQSIAADGVTTPEGPTMPVAGGGIWTGRNQYEVFLFENAYYGGRRVWFYDVRTQQVVSTFMRIGVAYQSVTYAPEFGVFVSLHQNTSSDTYEMRVWATETMPANISDPVVITGQAKGGHVAEYQVQVTGADGEPVEKELIDWSVTGAGRLLHPQSMTDVNGYASTWVLHDLDDTGDVTVEASLKC